MEKILTINDICLKYHTSTSEIDAIKNLSFDICKGEFVSIIGPSGCGKTSILSIISGLYEPSDGKISFSNNLSKNSVGYMLQKDHLFPWRNVEKNTYLPLEIKKILNKENTLYVNNLLEKYGLKSFSKSYPDELSGGMRQRVALIRTLSTKPELLLLDEPFSALDYQTRLNVCDDVYRIIKQEKKTALLVTHDISEAISMSDKIIVLTKRPATVKKIFYPKIEGDSPILKRESKDFSFWFEQIWKELN